MNERTRSLAAQAAELEPAERVELVDEILATVEDDADWRRAWSREAAHRVAAYERDELQAVDFDSALEELRAKHAPR